MNHNGQQDQLLGLIWRPYWHPFRLHVNDIIRIAGRLGRVIRVTECAAVVLINRPAREFTTRFDRHVRFRPPPVMIRISANSETEILNRKRQKKRKGSPSHSGKPDSRISQLERRIT
jgi:hypothetical protein